MSVVVVNFFHFIEYVKVLDSFNVHYLIIIIMTMLRMITRNKAIAVIVICFLSLHTASNAASTSTQKEQQKLKAAAAALEKNSQELNELIAQSKQYRDGAEHGKLHRAPNEAITVCCRKCLATKIN